MAHDGMPHDRLEGLGVGRHQRRIDEITETRPAPIPRLMAMAAPMEGGADTAPSAVHVGEVDIDASVTVTFELE